MNKNKTIEVRKIIGQREGAKDVYDATSFTVTFRTKREELPDQIIKIVSGSRGDGLEIYTTNGRLVIEPQASNHIYLTQSKKF